MKIINHKLEANNKHVILELMTFENNDLKIFKSTFNKYKSINKVLKGKLKGTRIMNFPEALSESVFCLAMNCGKLLSAKKTSGYSTSFDAYDTAREKRIQIKCSASSGPTSFGPRSEYDEIYFVDFKSNGLIDGTYKIYKIENDDIDSVKVNKNQSLVDQQKQNKRPRFEIRSQLVVKKKLEPIFSGRL
ncbi:Bsp6I family type II restriction endonuclease [Candidatus Pelagibacter sp.]|jgi:hypothetical protein|nr:Bsp6I family type II restriction endonuclease [Candidatus Pelagibacter sp.]|tara:strand:+ start:320 stop:886 length:567 start_codon:yes stop_codon:yes gene_type:complete